jgi:hypothetical protein
MHWVKVTNPQYEQSQRYVGEVGEVVGRWGPENSASGREGYLVEFADGEIVGVTGEEVEELLEPPASADFRSGPEDGATFH